MTLEEAIKNLKKLKSFHNGSYGTAIDMAIKALEHYELSGRQIERSYEMEYTDGYNQGWKDGREALEQQPSDSNISDPCDGCRYELNSTNGNPCYSCGKYKMTEQQPSVYPERPKGKWIHKMQVMNNPYTYKCSVCKEWQKDKTKYCPNCGADMSGGEEDEVSD